MKPEFKPFPKLARLSREVIITEKIDGTNASIFITDTPDFRDPMMIGISTDNSKLLGIYAGSRTRWITPKSDNHGFAAWVEENQRSLM